MSQHCNEVKLVQDCDMIFIAHHHFPFNDSIQNVKRVEKLRKGLYSSDRDAAAAIVKAVMIGASLQLHSMRSVKVTKKLFHTMDMVNSDPSVHGLVSGGVNVAYVNGRPFIFFIAPHDFAFNFLLQRRTVRGRTVGFSGPRQVIA